jgi:predicted O-methyltransferase YrrM
MNPARTALAAEILATSRAHDARQTDRLARYRNLEPETAMLLSVLIRATNARRVLEIGTLTGTRRCGWPMPSRRPAVTWSRWR